MKTVTYVSLTSNLGEFVATTNLKNGTVVRNMNESSRAMEEAKGGKVTWVGGRSVSAKKYNELLAAGATDIGFYAASEWQVKNGQAL